MKKSLRHLPKHKRDELQRVTEIILDECPKLSHIVVGHDPAFLTVFPKATPEQEERTLALVRRRAMVGHREKYQELLREMFQFDCSDSDPYYVNARTLEGVFKSRMFAELPT